MPDVQPTPRIDDDPWARGAAKVVNAHLLNIKREIEAETGEITNIAVFTFSGSKLWSTQNQEFHPQTMMGKILSAFGSWLVKLPGDPVKLPNNQQAQKPKLDG